MGFPRVLLLTFHDEINIIMLSKMALSIAFNV